MPCNLLRRLVLVALAVPALAAAQPGAARAGLSAPVINRVEQASYIIVDWTSADSYDYYTVSYRYDGQPVTVSGPTGSGTGGEYLIPLPDVGVLVDIQVTGWRVAG